MSMVDGFSRYNQVAADKEDQKKTSFTTPWGTFGEPWYCTKSAATPRGCPTLIYQPEVHTKFEVTVLYTQQMHSVHVILFCFMKGYYFYGFSMNSVTLQ